MVSVIGRRALAIAVGLVLDRLVPEPTDRWHPVARFGSVMTHFERRTYADSRLAGVRYATAGVALGAVGGALVRSIALASLVAVGGSALRGTAEAIGTPLTAGDVDAARAALPALVGRDVADLDASAVSAAVIESVAENSVDAVLGSVVWGLVAGAPGILAHRAVNTMDAMVGHHTPRHERFGWGAARLDDAVNLGPARLFAGLVALAEPSRTRDIVRLVRRDGPTHPSPNSGIAETAVAAALGVGLGGPLRYGDRVENRPRLGDGPRPGPSDIQRATRLTNRVEWIATALLVVVWWMDHTRNGSKVDVR